MRISQALNHKGPDSDLTLVRTALKSWKLHLTHTASRVVRLGGESEYQRSFKYIQIDIATLSPKQIVEACCLKICFNVGIFNYFLPNLR